MHRTGARQAGLRVRRQRESDGPGDGPRDLALQDQDVAEVALIGLGPDVGLVDGLDELSGDAHALTGAAEAALQDVVRPQLPAGPVRADVVTDWNLTTLQAATAVSPNQRQQRVAAMVHAAMHDAVNSVAPRYKAYAVQVSPSGEASIEAAAVQAAYGVLIRLLPGRRPCLDAARSASLSQIPDGPAKEEGLAVGEAVAGRIVALRSTDGSDVDGTYVFGSGPGEYQRTPPTFGNPAIPAWRFVKPFVLKRRDQFRADGPPSLAATNGPRTSTKSSGSEAWTVPNARPSRPRSRCAAPSRRCRCGSGGAQRVGPETRPAWSRMRGCSPC